MEDKQNEIEKRLQELIRQKTNENTALNKLLGKLSANTSSGLWPRTGEKDADHQ